MKHPTYVLDEEFAARIRAWRDADPDAGCVTDLDVLVQSARRGDDDALTELQDAFTGMLRFGTAGLRGRMAPGPNRMNSAVVRKAAWALARSVPTESSVPPVCVIGYDSRYRSRHFAEESAAVLAAAGWRALVMPRALPTPILAFAVRHLQTDLGIMVTASHNPPRDNGYKVYLGDGRQIIEPIDSGVADAMTQAPPAREIATSREWEFLDDRIVEAYLASAVEILQSASTREVTLVHTALHGVSTEVFATALTRAGFPAPIEVTAQRDPDPDFPTLDFPNPEEAGALDLAIATALEHDADAIIAHDPDADRCAVAIPTADGWRMLTGDEVGALLGAWLIEQHGPIHGRFAASLVSGSWLQAIADGAGIGYDTTLTGFKWITRTPELRFGYEEALGYCVDPEHVADKDGITAGLLFAEFLAETKRQGRAVTDVLAELSRRFGVHATRGVSFRRDHPAQIAELMAALLASPPTDMAGFAVVDTIDLSQGWAGLPPTTGLLMTLRRGEVAGRLIIRPSGTEPKVKAYLQVVTPAGGDPEPAAEMAQAALTDLEDTLTALIDAVGGLP